MANISATTVTLALLLFFTYVHAEMPSFTNRPIGAIMPEPNPDASIDTAKLACLQHLTEVDHDKTCLHRVENALSKRGKVSFFELAIWPGCCKAFDIIRSKYPGDRCRETLVGRPIGEADALILFMYCRHDNQ